MHYTPALRGALDAAQQGELAGRLHADGLFTREVEALSLLHLVRQFPVLLAELEALEASCIATAHTILRHLDPATRRVFEEEGLRAAAAVERDRSCNDIGGRKYGGRRRGGGGG